MAYWACGMLGDVRMLGMWDTGYAGCWGCEILGDMGCLGCVNVWDLGWLGCGMFEMLDVGDVGCWECGMFGMQDMGYGIFAGMWNIDLQKT